MLSSLKVSLVFTLGLFLSHLLLDHLELLLPVLLFDLLLNFCARRTDIVVDAQGLYGLLLGAIKHDLILLLD